ncbi:Rab proteins geranylgeranyltransferase component A 2 [Liparis tanakae]|uniref:Rab proteins geranylgeranyltransferase component A 2 n=1 Tax=Liparis tanakae TaxID=230148 RepID=A0A4Z2EEK2_9TELE|nr:Rab proteins geranylgeranyltransferase component A 2 [Liparis tanakae]
MATEDLPSEFDVVILGTGLAESVAAAAFSRAGQRVLHVDRRSFYAAHWASFTFTGLLAWIQQQQEEPQPEEVQDWSSLLQEGEELIALSNSDSASIRNLQVFCFTSTVSTEFVMLLSVRKMKNLQTQLKKSEEELMKSQRRLRPNLQIQRTKKPTRKKKKNNNNNNNR